MEIRDAHPWTPKRVGWPSKVILMKVPQEYVGVYESSCTLVNLKYMRSVEHIPSPALASHRPSLENVTEFTHEL